MELARAVFRRNQEVLRRMHAAGVPILPGTDTGGNPLLPMGFALHDELAELVAIGMTPAETLRAATRDAAALLGHADELGVLREGALADLVILEADPLADIRNTTRIHAVVARGVLLDRTRIEAALPLPVHGAPSEGRR